MAVFIPRSWPQARAGFAGPGAPPAARGDRRQSRPGWTPTWSSPTPAAAPAPSATDLRVPQTRPRARTAADPPARPQRRHCHPRPTTQPRTAPRRRASGPPTPGHGTADTPGHDVIKTRKPADPRIRDRIPRDQNGAPPGPRSVRLPPTSLPPRADNPSGGLNHQGERGDTCSSTACRMSNLGRPVGRLLEPKRADHADSLAA